MKYLDLKEPSAACTLQVQKIERRKSKFGQDYALIGTVEHGEQASVSVPEKAMERQMANTLKVDDVESLKGRWVTVSRSDEPGANGKLFWNVVWAGEQAYEGPPAKAPEESKRVQPPPNNADTRTAGQKAFDEAVPPEPKAPAPAAPKADPQLPLEHDNDADAQKIVDNIEAKKRAGMNDVRKKFRALWESEAEFQILTAMSVRAKVAEKLQLPLEEVPMLVVDGSSVNAATASLWITFDRRNYV